MTTKKIDAKKASHTGSKKTTLRNAMPKKKSGSKRAVPKARGNKNATKTAIKKAAGKRKATTKKKATKRSKRDYVKKVLGKSIVFNGKTFYYKKRSDLKDKHKLGVVPDEAIKILFNIGPSRVVSNKNGTKKRVIDIRLDNSKLLKTEFGIKPLNKNLLMGYIAPNGTRISMLDEYLLGQIKAINLNYKWNPRDFWGKNTITLFNKTRIAIKQKRTIDEQKQIIYQKPAININNDYLISDFFDFENGFPKNDYIRFYDNNYPAFHDLLHQKLFRNKANNIDDAHIQLYYYTYDERLLNAIRHGAKFKKNEKPKTLGDIGVFRYVKKMKDFGENVDPLSLVFKLPPPASPWRFIVLGYRLAYSTKNNKGLTKTDLNTLKAFHPVSDKKYHSLTCASTSTNKLCIYETFLDIAEIRDLKYCHDNKSNHEKIKKMLSDEGEEIEKAVKNGELYKSIELLSKKYDIDVIVVYYGTLFHLKENVEKQLFPMNNQDPPTITSKGVTKQIKEPGEIYSLGGKKVMLYYKDIHVAPSIFNTEYYTQDAKNIYNKSKGFCLEPIKKKKLFKNKIGGILGYDFEVYKETKSIPFAATIYGHLIDKNGEEINVEKKFYGVGCEKELVEYIDSISKQINNKKTNAKGGVPKIHIYGFNNSNFDNLLIWEELYNKNKSLKYIMGENSIKYIEHNNCKIFDIACFYRAGGLRETAKQFALEEEKGVFPYTFPNKDNLNYVGKIPELKYWNSQSDYDEYLINDYLESEYENTEKDISFQQHLLLRKIHIESEYEKTDKKISKEQYISLRDKDDLKGYEPKEFDLKKYCLKYCTLDSKLVYEIAKIHLTKSRGSINGRLYDVSGCITSAGMSLKIFQQCFLEDTLYQSPDDITVKERLAYKGGRTEVFKKKFIDCENLCRLFYLDINSSYPGSMKKHMPLSYITNIEYENEIDISMDKIVPYHLYFARGEYHGTDKNFIPNILVRESGNIIACKNFDFSYQWGCELIEAIKNGCKIFIKEEIKYQPKKIFKKFSKYFYGERLKFKNNNPAYATFLKNVMNSLYGKFGQKIFTIKEVFQTMNEVYGKLKGDDRLLIDIVVLENHIIAEYEKTNMEYDSIGKLIRFSSYIAALSRCKLSKMMREVGHENVYYCDTDSVFTSKMPNEKYIDQTRLGAWKLECEPIIEAYFIAPKCYTYKCETMKESKRAKGVKASKLEFSDYKKLNDGETTKIEQTNPLFKRSMNGIIITDEVRTIQPIYNKRIWDGNDSEAFTDITKWAEFNGIKIKPVVCNKKEYEYKPNAEYSFHKKLNQNDILKMIEENKGLEKINKYIHRFIDQNPKRHNLITELIKNYEQHFPRDNKMWKKIRGSILTNRYCCFCECKETPDNLLVTPWSMDPMCRDCSESLREIATKRANKYIYYPLECDEFVHMASINDKTLKNKMKNLYDLFDEINDL